MLLKRTDQPQDMDPDILATLVTGLVPLIQAILDMDLAILVTQATLVTALVLVTLATLDMDLVIPVTFIQHLALATQVIQDTDLVILAIQATLDMDQDILVIQATL